MIGALDHHGGPNPDVKRTRVAEACQTISKLALERNAPIGSEEFRVLNKCLDGAIAEAVTEHERQHALDALADGARHSNQHLGMIAHELHVLIGSAMIAFDALRAGSVGIRGSTGDVLERNLVGLRDLVDRSLTEARLAAGIARHERVAVARFIEDIEVSAVLSAHARRLRLTVTEVDPEVTVETDRQILSSVVSSLLQNAFRHTRPHTHIRLHTHATAERVLFDIEDQCGGIPPGKSEHLFELHEPNRDDPTRRKPGLAICIRGVHALRGELRVRNQNSGCVFTVDLPRSPV